MTIRALGCALSGAFLLGASSGRADNPSKVECVVANETGQILVQSGQRIEAERKFTACNVPGCPAPVRADCAQRLIELDAVIPSIIFELKDSAGQPVRAARVTMDGQSAPDALGEKPFRVDAGERRFSFEAEGFSPIEKTFTLREGEKNRKETIVLPAVPAPEPPRRALLAEVPTLAYVAAGVGVAGMAVGIGAGIAASSRNSALESECPARHCPADAQHDIDAFRTWRDWSTGGYVLARHQRG